ncbi:MAG: hypothetical protein Q7J72_01410 [Candidatus Omnitrophota bacterium]|nr:hypothetical protein [Candidatus Omnitrophota bacterium]
MNKVRKSNKLTIIMLIVGLLMVFSSPFGGGNSLYAGLVITFGVLGHNARKSQQLGGSKLWLLVEFPSVLIIILLFILGLFKGFWYEYPISFLLAPAIFLYHYIKTWRNKSNDNKALVRCLS